MAWRTWWWAFRVRGGPGPDGGGASGLLLESPADSFLLLESGDYLLLEQ